MRKAQIRHRPCFRGLRFFFGIRFAENSKITRLLRKPETEQKVCVASMGQPGELVWLPPVMQVEH